MVDESHNHDHVQQHLEDHAYAKRLTHKIIKMVGELWSQIMEPCDVLQFIR